MKPLFFRWVHLWAVFMVFAFLPTHARAAEEDSAHALQALETALHNEAAAAKTPSVQGREAQDEESSLEGRRGEATANWTVQLRANLEQGEYEQAQRLLSELAAYSKSEPVLSACKQVREAIQRERETKEQSVLRRYHEAEANAESAVKSARAPVDLDAALRKLSETSDAREDYRASGAVRAEASHVQSLRRYVILWQDYLASRQYGDDRTALEKLRSVSQEGLADVLPRSDILARIEELKRSQETSAVDRAGAVLGKLKTLDQIAEVVPELRTLQAHSGNDYSSGATKVNLDSIINELQSYAEIYTTYKAGLPTPVETLTNRSWSGTQQPPAEVQNLKAQLLRLLCERQFNLGDRLKPGENEPIPDYLSRVQADARERGDARMIMRVRDIQRQIGSRAGAYTPPASPEATGALQAIMAAQNQQEAGQYIPAVVSYENALKNGSDVVPAKVIGARLDAIKAAHPAEYDQGMQISLGASNGTKADGVPSR